MGNQNKMYFVLATNVQFSGELTSIDDELIKKIEEHEDFDLKTAENRNELNFRIKDHILSETEDDIIDNVVLEQLTRFRIERQKLLNESFPNDTHESHELMLQEIEKYREEIEEAGRIRQSKVKNFDPNDLNLRYKNQTQYRSFLSLVNQIEKLLNDKYELDLSSFEVLEHVPALCSAHNKKWGLTIDEGTNEGYYISITLLGVHSNFEVMSFRSHSSIPDQCNTIKNEIFQILDHHKPKDFFI